MKETQVDTDWLHDPITGNRMYEVPTGAIIPPNTPYAVLYVDGSVATVPKGSPDEIDGEHLSDNPPRLFTDEPIPCSPHPFDEHNKSDRVLVFTDSNRPSRIRVIWNEMAQSWMTTYLKDMKVLFHPTLRDVVIRLGRSSLRMEFDSRDHREPSTI